MTGGSFSAEQYAWERIADHDHAFASTGRETRTALVEVDGDDEVVIAG